MRFLRFPFRSLPAVAVAAAALAALLLPLPGPAPAADCPSVDFNDPGPRRRIIGVVGPDAARCFILKVRPFQSVGLVLDQGAEEGVRLAVPERVARGTDLVVVALTGVLRLDVEPGPRQTGPVPFRIVLGPLTVASAEPPAVPPAVRRPYAREPVFVRERMSPRRGARYTLYAPWRQPPYLPPKSSTRPEPAPVPAEGAERFRDPPVLSPGHAARLSGVDGSDPGAVDVFCEGPEGDDALLLLKKALDSNPFPRPATLVVLGWEPGSFPVTLRLPRPGEPRLETRVGRSFVAALVAGERLVLKEADGKETFSRIYNVRPADARAILAACPP